MNFVKKVVKARWFPTVTKPILAGLAASGIVEGLHALGVTSFTSLEVNSLVTPVVGFLVAAIVQKTTGSTSLGTVQVKATVATHTAAYEPQETLGKTIASTFLGKIADEIDSDPSLLQSVASVAFQRVLSPTQAADAAKAVTTAVESELPPVPAPVRSSSPPQEVVSTGNAPVVATGNP